MGPKLKMGMVGGGQNAFIGEVHRKAAALDGTIDLVCGAFSRSPENSRATGAQLGLDPGRVYESWETMLEAEQALPADQRMDLVSIVTPNDLHLPIAKAALDRGFHVISDKPATRDLGEALTLRDAVTASPALYAVTHTYLGYPMVKEARSLVEAGAIGRIRKLMIEYPQGWLSTLLEASEHKQASWRTDPARSGPSGAMGDIGTHAETLGEYVSGQAIAEVCADLTTFGPGRQLDDDGSVLFRTDQGARGILTASQICNGEENNLSIRIYGEDGGLAWQQDDANTLLLKRQGQPTQRLRAGSDNEYLSETARQHCRTPSGHPEGYLEAFANIYRNFALAIRARQTGQAPDPGLDYPSIEEGVSGLAFIDALLRNTRTNEKWTAVTRG